MKQDKTTTGLDIAGLKKLTADLAKAGVVTSVLEKTDGGQIPGLAFILKDLSAEHIKQVLGQVDLTLPISNDNLVTLNAIKKLVGENQYLQDLSTKDQLTGLYNFRHFSERLIIEIDRVKRTDRPCGLLIIDLDNFKPVNDAYGHQTGNQVLKNVAEIILEEVRTIDIVFRYGGDEFAVILPYTTATRAFKLAERIRATLAEDNRTRKYNVTGSFGLASYHFLDQAAIESLIEHADAAMYEAKQAGGNRVEVWKPDIEREKSTQVSIDEKQALFGKRD